MESDSHPKNHEMPGRLFPNLPIVTPGSPIFPTLPIVTADSPRLSQREKYGSLFYLGLLGLAVAIGLVAWFAHGAWEMRGVWSNIYVLHDEARPASDRVRAAFSLSRDPRVNQRQRWDICLRTPLPSLARYVVAESLTAEAAAADPRGYALTVARSPNWPDWLRLLLARPMAYAAVEGVTFPRVALEELRANPDPGVALWASFVVAQEDPKDRAGLPELEAACRRTGWERDLASLLREAARGRGRPAEQTRFLDRATIWLRANHPQGKAFWAPVTADEKELRIAPKPAPKLH
jgi:hypothetical protein